MRRYSNHSAKLVEVPIKGERMGDAEAFHDDLAGAVSKAPLLIAVTLEHVPRRREI